MNLYLTVCGSEQRMSTFWQWNSSSPKGSVHLIKFRCCISNNVLSHQLVTMQGNVLKIWNVCDHSHWFYKIFYIHTVKSRLSEHRLSETTWLFEDDGQSWLFSLLFIAIKLPIIRISIIRKNQFFEVIRRSRLKKLLLNYPSRFVVQMSRMVIMISLFGWVRLHTWVIEQTKLRQVIDTGLTLTLLRDEPLSE